MYNSNYDMNDYGNTNYDSNSKKSYKRKKSRIFTFCLFGFYVLCFVFLIIGIFSWWRNKEKFYLTTNAISMITNDRYQISLYGKTESKKVKDYKFTSSNPEIVTVDENGIIHSKSEGEAQVTVKSKYSSNTNVIDVTVEGDSFYSVTFGSDRVNMDLNEKIELKPVVNGDPNFKTDLNWKSSDNRIVVVNSKGVITAKKTGIAYITVGIKNTKITSKLKVNVSNNQFVKPEIAQTTSKINYSAPKILTEDSTDNGEEDVNTYVGVVDVEAHTKSEQLTVGKISKVSYKITPTNASNKRVTWSSSDESVATVDAAGIIRTHGVGTADISVKTQDGNKTSFVTLNVVSNTNNKPTIELNKKQTFMRAGETEQLVAITNPENMKVVWSSSNPKVADVTQDGKIMSKSMGGATIIAKSSDGKVQAFCKIIVTNNDILVQKINLNRTSVNLNRGAVFQLIYTVYPSNSVNQSLTFTSSNPAVARVDQKGKIVGVGTGKAVISARSNNGIVTNCKVSVTNVKIKSLSVKKSSIQLAKGKRSKIRVSINPRKASNQALLFYSKNKNVATVDSDGIITGVGLGTTTIVVKAQDGSGKFAKIKVVIVPNVGMINAKKSKFKNYYKSIENYIHTNHSKHMQNFAIQNPGKSNEVIFLSGVTSGNTADPMTKETKANLSRTLIARIPKSTIRTGKKKRSVMHLKNTGHGQSFDIEDNGTIWTNAKAVDPYFASDRWWGQHKGAMRINFKTNGQNSSFSSLATVYPIDSSTGKPYIGVDVSVDEANDLLATRSGKKVIVYKLSAAKKSRLVKLYEFEVNNTDTYRQGEDISGGYYYLLLGSAGNPMRLEVYDMLGNLKYAKSFYAASKSVSIKKEVEPEGLKIYGKKVFVGLTYDKNSRDTLFTIGYLG